MKGNGRILGHWSFKFKCSWFNFSMLSNTTSSLEQVRIPNLNVCVQFAMSLVFFPLFQPKKNEPALAFSYCLKTGPSSSKSG